MNKYLNLLDVCPNCGSGDINWCGISRRPYCNECNNWGAINFGSDEDAILSWNKRSSDDFIVKDIKMISAKEALAISNDKGKRKEKIKEQTEKIETAIIKEASNGRIDLEFYVEKGNEILPEVVDNLKSLGYIWIFVPQVGKVVITW